MASAPDIGTIVQKAINVIVSIIDAVLTQVQNNVSTIAGLLVLSAMAGAVVVFGRRVFTELGGLLRGFRLF
jgi:hypothetical protein